MAQESDLSKSAEKGKGKTVDAERKADEVQKDKDGKPIVNGKAGDDKDDCMFAVRREELIAFPSY